MRLRITLLVICTSLSLFVYAQQKEVEQVSPADNLIQYGALGAIVIAMFWYVLWLQREHRKERDILHEQLKDQQAVSNQTIKENTTILTGLKTLLEVDIKLKKQQ